jgi:hypothetical protein
MANSSPVMNRFEILKAKVLTHERLCGIYILEASPVSAHSVDQRQAFLRDFASRFGFSALELGPEEWKQAEELREDAHAKLVSALLGGGEIGHSGWDVPLAIAEALADEFFGLFEADARFFCSNFGSPWAQAFGNYEGYKDYIFGGGCVAIDPQLAAIFWMLDND